MMHAWEKLTVAPPETHHLYMGAPVYEARFIEALKFHPPGLAPVRDSSGAYHIDASGQAAYSQRYLRTFGFYQGRAAVQGPYGWLHLLPDGASLYPERYAWCGNFQEGRCPVRHPDGSYGHLNEDGRPAYDERYRYVGDYRDGYAVAQRTDGLHTHIDQSGCLLHRGWFLDLDVFHKGYARAKDGEGWFHIDRQGQPAYELRFNMVEPFYNGQARVETFDGSLLIVDERGDAVLRLREPLL